MKMIRKTMTDSSRCSDLSLSVVLAVLLTVLPVRVSGQQTVWDLPQYKETVSCTSVMAGNMIARDTYLSASRYDGWAVGFENDRWTGYRPYRLFCYGRSYSTLLFSPMNNRNGGGSTLGLGGAYHHAFLWPAISCSMCDLLIGPAVMTDFDVFYNQQNSNNPVNGSGYLAGGVCVDNTFRFRVLRYNMALQASLYLPLAGVGFAPDYDQPYYFMYKDSEYGRALHFVTPFNNKAITHQVALVLPFRGNRFRIGYSIDYYSNRLGGHSRNIGSGMLTIGCAFRYQSKEWAL